MAQKGIKGVRAVWQDALAELDAQNAVLDHTAGDEDKWGYAAGQWAGAPADKLPPGCPVVPLGIDGKIVYVVSQQGQVLDISVSEWTHNMLIHLFGSQPNYLYHHWPRWSEAKKNRPSVINGLEVKEVHQCLNSEAQRRGPFSLEDRVRGRGAWLTRNGQLVWHAGDMLFRINEKGKLVGARPGEVDGKFYPRLQGITRPWAEPVDPADTPAHDLLATFRTWSWERPVLDPIIALGWVCCAFLGAALPVRPHIFTIGDYGTGKSALQVIIKGILGDCLLRTNNTTPAGIYQAVRQDCLPVAVDELEAGADNRRTGGIIDLARLAYSEGGKMMRGGQSHKGVEFTLQNCFMFSAINPPPMEPADRSRMGVLNLRALKLQPGATKPVINVDHDGRMILRAIMDGWNDFKRLNAEWVERLERAGMESRSAETYAAFLGMAQLLVGDEALEEAGFDVTNDARMGAQVAGWTASDRADAEKNWISCLNYLFGCTIEAWKGGEKPTIGSTVEEWESGHMSATEANKRLHLVGLAVRGEVQRLDNGEGWRVAGDGDRPERRFLCVPISKVSAGLSALFSKTPESLKWAGGNWTSALKQGPDDVVIRDRGNGQNVKINRVTLRCLLIDLAAFDDAKKRGV